MSSAPTGTSVPSFSAIAAAIRAASGTPRRWMPMSSRPSVPACFSTISWDSRTVARRISSAVMIWRPLIAPSWPSPGLPGGLTGPWLKGRGKDNPGGSVDVHLDLGRAGVRGAGTDREEVRSVEVDDAALLLRPVVVDDADDATAIPADLDDRATRQPHRCGAVVVERRPAAERVFRRARERGRQGPLGRLA